MNVGGGFLCDMTKEIQLTRGRITLVDDADFEWLNQWRWCYHDGYAQRHSARAGGEGHMIFMHREIIQPLKGMKTDHRDRDKLNNQRSNLRVCSTSENHMNKGKQKNNTSGYKGVSWHRQDKKWRAYINVNRKQFHLGNFSAAKDAARAYDEASIRYHGEFGLQNLTEENQK